MIDKRLFFPLIMLALVSGIIAAAGGESESGKYYLFLQGQHFGSESYQIKKDEDGKIITSSETEMIMLEGDVQNRLVFTSRLVMDAKTLAPSYYEYRFKSGRNDGYEVLFDGKQITRKLITGGNISSKTTTAEQDVLVKDHNIYHHYQLMLDRYDAKKKGKQVFSNYLPLVGDEVDVSLTLNGEVPLLINQRTIPTLNYSIDYPLNYGADVWTTKEGRVVKIRIKQNGIEAVRDNYVTLAKK